ncbi:MAG: hypothetical protein GX096_03470 [Clostridiales bacterium]|nr:hypothetical protein [Clostridiales bacterium]
MRLITGQAGIISYAGLDKELLLAKARIAYQQQGNAVPARFSSFLPLFPIELVQNMSYIGKKAGNLVRKSFAGFSIDPIEYHTKLYAQMPELYRGDNQRRNLDYDGNFHGRGVVTVDASWAAAFPQYEPFLGERLCIYLIGGGHQAAAVPESIYPRGGGIVRAPETDMLITRRCAHFTAYMKERMAHGEAYDAAKFEGDYIIQNMLEPVTITQSEIGRLMQDLSIIKNLQDEESKTDLYTEHAKKAEHIPQYVPFRYGCDTFESIPASRTTLRLAQLYFEGDDTIRDLWMPYQDVAAYLNKQTMTLDIAALCGGFQIAPAQSGKGSYGTYPDQIRVVLLRDRSLPLMQTSTINNPAYGRGMNPLGMINKLIYLSESDELWRQGKIEHDPVSILCENTTLSAQPFLRMKALAELQEYKGRLIDAMYRRESALSQLEEGTKAYTRAQSRLDQKVRKLTTFIQQTESQLGGCPMSGYDADIHYLDRKHRAQIGLQDESEFTKAPPFAVDALREQSVESGYAMRSSIKFFAHTELYDPTLERDNEFVEPEDVDVDDGTSGTDEPMNDVNALAAAADEIFSSREAAAQAKIAQAKLAANPSPVPAEQLSMLDDAAEPPAAANTSERAHDSEVHPAVPKIKQIAMQDLIQPDSKPTIG